MPKHPSQKQHDKAELAKLETSIRMQLQAESNPARLVSLALELQAVVTDKSALETIPDTTWRCSYHQDDKGEPAAFSGLNRMLVEVVFFEDFNDTGEETEHFPRGRPLYHVACPNCKARVKADLMR